MAHTLKNNNLEINIDLPHENYQLARFDWTGKIVAVKYRNTYVTGREMADGEDESLYGKGLYNEFGINAPLGYHETEAGSWFHKIGVGLLRKEEGHYDFKKAYEIRPSEFSVVAGPGKLLMTCRSQSLNGYSYVLEKEIKLLESGFEINYRLENTGEKPLSTNEYNHNFLCIDGALIGSNYILKFPFPIKAGLMGEVVNPEQLVDIGQREITFRGTPKQPFFFSNLSGGELVEAKWELENIKSNIGISETGDFQTDFVNLWGWGHVLSPELFLNMTLQAGQSREWSRVYAVYDL